jgi:hypothetical protein
MVYEPLHPGIVDTAVLKLDLNDHGKLSFKVELSER